MTASPTPTVFIVDMPRTRGRTHMKYWEIIADNLNKTDWSWGCVSAVDSNGRTILIADAHRGDGKRFVVQADEKPKAFLELERVTRITSIFITG
jgi:hypothetical protein